MKNPKRKGRPKKIPRNTFIDISAMIRSGMVHWPGDPAVKISRIHSIRKGDAANVSRIEMGSHSGTHMDAPRHFIERGKGIDQMPLDATIGEARVIDIHDPVCIKPEELRKHRIQSGERILLRTSNSLTSRKQNSFVKDFVYLSLAAARFLVQCRVRTVGVDYLSVGGYRADGAATHQALLRAGIWIIEGLDLMQAKAGKYELVCLPLKLSRGDGAPARAILMER